MSTVASIVLDYIHTRIVKRRFELLQSVDNGSWKMMIGAYQARDKKQKVCGFIQRWLDNVKEAKESELLTDLQKKEWAAIAA